MSTEAEKEAAARFAALPNFHKLPRRLRHHIMSLESRLVYMKAAHTKTANDKMEQVSSLDGRMLFAENFSWSLKGVAQLLTVEENQFVPSSAKVMFFPLESPVFNEHTPVVTIGYEPRTQMQIDIGDGTSAATNIEVHQPYGRTREGRTTNTVRLDIEVTGDTAMRFADGDTPYICFIPKDSSSFSIVVHLK